METSGNMSTSSAYVNYTISISQNWQSIDGNYSNVTVSVCFFRTNVGYTLPMVQELVTVELTEPPILQLFRQVRKLLVPG